MSFNINPIKLPFFLHNNSDLITKLEFIHCSVVKSLKNINVKEGFKSIQYRE